MQQIPYMDPKTARTGCLALLVCAGLGAAASYFALPSANLATRLLPGLLVGMVLGSGIVEVLRRRQRQELPMRMVQVPAPRAFTSDPWEEKLALAASTSPIVASQLAQVMWLDEYLMQVIPQAAGGEPPGMQLAWSLCVEIARELSLPAELGPDWVSYHASPVGKRLGLTPVKPAQPY